MRYFGLGALLVVIGLVMLAGPPIWRMPTKVSLLHNAAMLTTSPSLVGVAPGIMGTA
jgi:hypothetical protein